MPSLWTWAAYGMIPAGLRSQNWRRSSCCCRSGRSHLLPRTVNGNVALPVLI